MLQSNYGRNSVCGFKFFTQAVVSSPSFSAHTFSMMYKYKMELSQFVNARSTRYFAKIAILTVLFQLIIICRRYQTSQKVGLFYCTDQCIYTQSSFSFRNVISILQQNICQKSEKNLFIVPTSAAIRKLYLIKMFSITPAYRFHADSNDFLYIVTRYNSENNSTQKRESSNKKVSLIYLKL